MFPDDQRQIVECQGRNGRDNLPHRSRISPVTVTPGKVQTRDAQPPKMSEIMKENVGAVGFGNPGGGTSSKACCKAHASPDISFHVGRYKELEDETLHVALLVVSCVAFCASTFRYRLGDKAWLAGPHPLEILMH